MEKRITEIKAGRNKDRVDILFDDGSVLNLDRGLIPKKSLHVFQVVNYDDLDEIVKEDDFRRCYDAALYFLEYRPRSETELRNHLLLKHKFSDDAVTTTVEKLKEMKLIDDRAFAESWIKNRIAHKQKSRSTIRCELIQKGIDTETIREITDGVDDAESALSSGLKKAKLLKNTGYPEFSKHLSAYLGRRGYSLDVIHSVVPKLWRNITGELTED